MASTNVASLGYIKEVTPGTTPTTPAFQDLPITGVDLTDNITTKTSEVLRTDRMVDDLVLVDAEVKGPAPFELSYEPWKPLMISLLQNAGASTTVAIAAATDLLATAASSTFGSTITDFVAEGVIVGMHIKTSGFVNAANNGVFRVASVTTATIVVTATTLVDEAAGASVDVSGLCHRNGNEVPDAYTFRKGLAVPGVAESIFYYRGVEVSAMTLDFKTGEILSGEVQFTGLTAEGTVTPITSETIVSAPAYTIMNSVSSVTSVELTGLPANAFFKELSLSVDNSANSQKGIATLGARNLSNFTLNVTGAIEMYFEDLSLYNQYKNATQFAVSLTMQDGDGNIVVITLPKCKFEELTEPVPGKDEFLMESGTLRALRDTVTNCQIQFDFFTA